jgi:hypothetical protein
MTREEQGQGMAARTWKKQTTTIHKESRLTPFQEGEDDMNITEKSYIVFEDLESRTTPFQEGVVDEDMLTIPVNHHPAC